MSRINKNTEDNCFGTQWLCLSAWEFCLLSFLSSVNSCYVPFSTPTWKGLVPPPSIYDRFFWDFVFYYRNHFCHQKILNVPTNRPYFAGPFTRKTGFLFIWPKIHLCLFSWFVHHVLTSICKHAQKLNLSPNFVYFSPNDVGAYHLVLKNKP